jgi:GT2 family glycosyltransferase
MKIGVVLLNYNNYKVTIMCLKALYVHYSKEDIDLVIVENGSKNNSLLIISEFLKEIEFNHKIIHENDVNSKSTHKINIISLKDNVGYANGNNFGIKYLLNNPVDHILILTNDIIFKDNIIPSLINTLEERKDIGMVSPILIKEDETIDFNCCRRSPSNFDLILSAFSFLNLSIINNKLNKLKILIHYPELLQDKIITCEILSGSCMMAKSSTWRDLDGFDKNTYLYFEENIQFHKLKEINLKSAILTDQKVLHLGGQSTKTMINISLLYAELNSLMYYLKKYRKLGFLKTRIIKYMWLFRILLLRLNSYLK